VSPEERDDAAQEPESNGAPEEDAPEAEAPEPAAPESDAPAEEPEAEAVPGEPGEAAPEEESGEPAPEQEPEETAAPAQEPAAGAEEGGAEGEDERPRGRRPEPEAKGKEEEVIPGAHLEPDLVLEEEQRSQSEFGEYADTDETAEEGSEEASEEGAEPAPLAREPLALAADARYGATGKRKSAIARVILKPGEGTYTVNGRHLDEYFPRIRLQRMARQPLEAAGYQNRMDVVARIHGGGVSAQATALRHGVARALVEADPALRGELKRRGYLTRDPRVKERKKAGLKKARKRPQFSKR
jgi:small subunit ribosomal protein S9